jgi:hypothetical protein
VLDEASVSPYNTRVSADRSDANKVDSYVTSCQYDIIIKFFFWCVSRLSTRSSLPVLTKRRTALSAQPTVGSFDLFSASQTIPRLPGLDAEVRLVFGDYQCLMQRVVDNLKQAVPFAANATQTSMLNKYIERSVALSSASSIARLNQATSASRRGR